MMGKAKSAKSIHFRSVNRSVMCENNSDIPVTQEAKIIDKKIH